MKDLMSSETRRFATAVRRMHVLPNEPNEENARSVEMN
jgi:hypothetical protein